MPPEWLETLFNKIMQGKWLYAGLKIWEYYFGTIFYTSIFLVLAYMSWNKLKNPAITLLFIILSFTWFPFIMISEITFLVYIFFALLITTFLWHIARKE